MHRRGKRRHAADVVGDAHQQRSLPVSHAVCGARSTGRRTRGPCRCDCPRRSKPTSGMNTTSSSRAGRGVPRPGSRMPKAPRRRGPSSSKKRMRLCRMLVMRGTAMWQPRRCASCSSGRGIQLVGHGKVQPDPAAGSQPAGGIDEPGNAQGGIASCLAGNGATPRTQLATQVPEGRWRGEGCRSRSGGRERRRRHPPVPVRTVALEPEQQVGQAIGR